MVGLSRQVAVVGQAEMRLENRWTNQSTGREWQVTILARDAADAEAQGRSIVSAGEGVDQEALPSNVNEARTPPRCCWRSPGSAVVLALVARLAVGYFDASPHDGLLICGRLDSAGFIRTVLSPSAARADR